MYIGVFVFLCPSLTDTVGRMVSTCDMHISVLSMDLTIWCFSNFRNCELLNTLYSKYMSYTCDLKIVGIYIRIKAMSMCIYTYICTIQTPQLTKVRFRVCRWQRAGAV